MIHGFCQNGNCKNPAQVQVRSGVEEVLEKDKDEIPTKIGQRRLDLCAEDAAYFLSIRDSDPPKPKRLEEFVKRCHQD